MHVISDLLDNLLSFYKKLLVVNYCKLLSLKAEVKLDSLLRH